MIWNHYYGILIEANEARLEVKSCLVKGHVYKDGTK